MGKRTLLSVDVEDVEKRKYPSKHYVYVIAVSWSDGVVNVVYRRYSKFFELQSELLDKFPIEGGERDPGSRIIPFLPGKILLGRSHVRQVALKRLAPINEYCKALIKLPSHISECREVLHFFEPQSEDLLSDEQIAKRDEPISQIKEITEPILLEQYTVVANYKKDGSGEVSLTAGSAVEVVEKTDKGWWFVTSDEGQGWVPSAYLERADGQEDRRQLAVQSRDAKKYVCTRSYAPQLPDEIKLDKGGMVEVLERNLDGWWLVKYKGKTGLAPALYLNRTDTLKANRLIGREPKLAVQMVTNVMSLSGEDSEDSSSQASASHRPPQRLAQKPNSNPANQGQPVNRLYQKKGKPLPNATPHLRLPNNNSDSASSGGEGSPIAARKKPIPPRRGTLKLPTKSSLAPVAPPAEEPVYVALADFSNQAQDGIDLKEGSSVEVLQKSSTGWWYVKTNGVEGWAPESYIEKQFQSAQKPKPLRPPPPASSSPRAASPVTTSNVPNQGPSSNHPAAATGGGGITDELQRKLALRSAAIVAGSAKDAEDARTRPQTQTADESPGALSRSNALKPKVGSKTGIPPSETTSMPASFSASHQPDPNYEDVSDDDQDDYEVVEETFENRGGLPLYQNINSGKGKNNQQSSAGKKNTPDYLSPEKTPIPDYLKLIEDTNSTRVENTLPTHVSNQPDSDSDSDLHDYVNDVDYVNTLSKSRPVQAEAMASLPNPPAPAPKGKVASIAASLGLQPVMGMKPNPFANP